MGSKPTYDAFVEEKASCQVALCEFSGVHRVNHNNYMDV